MGSARRTKVKTRRRIRDLDQIHADLNSPTHLIRHTSSRPAEDLPGLGQWYCIECAKWFEGEWELVEHRRGGKHKRRLRALREKPYSQKEAEAAVGLGTDNGKGSGEEERGVGIQNEEVEMADGGEVG